MYNDQNQDVDLYVPRKCSATNRLIIAKDHGSVQVNVGEVDESGRLIPGQNVTFALAGAVRQAAEADDSLNRLFTEAGLLKQTWSYSQ